METKDPNDFTEREKYILSFYKSGLASRSRRVPYDLIIGVVSVGFVVLAIVREEVSWGISGYLLLLGRLFYLATEGGRWSKDFQSIFVKYDAKLKALGESAQKDAQPK